MKTHNKILSAILGCMLILGAVSCNQKAKEDENAKKIAAVMNAIKAKSDSVEKIYLATIDQIDSSLNNLRDKEGLIILGSGSNVEMRKSKKDQILNNISMINDLLKENRAKIALLEKNLVQYKQYKTSYDELSQALKIEKEKSESLEKQITVMKLALIEKDFTIAELNKSNSVKDSSIQVITAKNAVQDKKLKTAYFAYGTYKQLKENNIVEKEGGLLGVRKLKVLNANLDKASFTEMDVSKDTAILVYGKKPTIITKHPVGTYKLVAERNDSTLLTINNPEKFWGISKYLVVEVH